MRGRGSFVGKVLMLGGAILLLAPRLPPARAQSAPPPQDPVQVSTPQRPVFRAGANFVVVDAYPQKDGVVVEGLKVEDFEVLEDGRPQTIESLQFIRVEPQAETARRDPNNTREMYAEAADPTNRVFVVFLDALHVTLDGSHRMRAPLVKVLNQVIGPNDLFGVTTQEQTPRQLILGRRLLTVEEQLTRNWPWGVRGQLSTNRSDPGEVFLQSCFGMLGTDTWFVADGAAMRPLADVLIERRREDRTLASLEQMVAFLGTMREARTVLMVVTNGWRMYGPDRGLEQEASKHPSGPPGVVRSGGNLLAQPTPGTLPDGASCNTELLRLAQLDDQRRIRDLISLANRNNVSFYPIAPGGIEMFDTPINQEIYINPNAQPGQSILTQEFDRTRDRVTSLQTIAENTDGVAIVNTNDLDAGLKRLVNDVSAYYLLGYYSTNTKFDGKYRRIQVKVKTPGIDVKARRGYLSPDAAAIAAAAEAPPPEKAGPPPEAEAALGDLGRLRTDSELFLRAAATPGVLRIAAELGRGERARHWTMEGGEVQVAVTTEDGKAVGLGTGQIAPATRGALVVVPIMAGAEAPWRVTVTIGEGGDRLQDQIAVPAGAATTGAIGEALLFRATPSARSPLLAVADALYRRTERMHVEFPILTALDNRSARLLGRDGQPLPVPVAVTERDREGQPMLATDLTLAPLTEGDYLLEVTASAGGIETRRFIAIRVVR